MCGNPAKVKARLPAAGGSHPRHTPASHTGPTFASWWDRKPLSELYLFITTRMPKNEPGSLQPDEYVDLVAYLLKLNELPSGSDPLPADSVALKKIRIEVGKKDP